MKVHLYYSQTRPLSLVGFAVHEKSQINERNLPLHMPAAHVSVSLLYDSVQHLEQASWKWVIVICYTVITESYTLLFFVLKQHKMSLLLSIMVIEDS